MTKAELDIDFNLEIARIHQEVKSELLTMYNEAKEKGLGLLNEQELRDEVLGKVGDRLKEYKGTYALDHAVFQDKYVEELIELMAEGGIVSEGEESDRATILKILLLKIPVLRDRHLRRVENANERTILRDYNRLSLWTNALNHLETFRFAFKGAIYLWFQKGELKLDDQFQLFRSGFKDRVGSVNEELGVKAKNQTTSTPNSKLKTRQDLANELGISMSTFYRRLKAAEIKFPGRLLQPEEAMKITQTILNG